MTVVANEKPKEFWAELICQDKVVPHPEDLIWVFRRSHVNNRPNLYIDPLGLDLKGVIEPFPMAAEDIAKLSSGQIGNPMVWLDLSNKVWNMALNLKTDAYVPPNDYVGNYITGISPTLGDIYGCLQMVNTMAEVPMDAGTLQSDASFIYDLQYGLRETLNGVQDVGDVWSNFAEWLNKQLENMKSTLSQGSGSSCYNGGDVYTPAGNSGGGSSFNQQVTGTYAGTMAPSFGGH